MALIKKKKVKKKKVQRETFYTRLNPINKAWLLAKAAKLPDMCGSDIIDFLIEKARKDKNFVIG